MRLPVRAWEKQNKADLVGQANRLWLEKRHGLNRAF
jgi:hypothetical protein